mmetsp:Transcript_20195/g.61296  ORF Transcript_20195/g.61296 Transcript_20195/m.61296 type:complete len:84 (+) Transcript_20195:616-867(+)
MKETIVDTLNEKIAEVLSEDIPTEVLYLSPEEAKAACGTPDADFSHITAPTIRVVTVAGGGTCPCGGTHVRSTAEVGGVTLEP